MKFTETMQRPRTSAAAAVLFTAVVFSSAVASDDPFEYAEDELAFTLNPLHESSMAETRLNELLFEPLWGPAYDGAPEPRLADAYEIDEDRMGMTIFLRENVSWSDGRPFTSKDVAFTIRAYQNPKTASPDRSRLAFVKKVEEKGDYTVKVTFVDPETEEAYIHSSTVPCVGEPASSAHPPGARFEAPPAAGNPGGPPPLGCPPLLSPLCSLLKVVSPKTSCVWEKSLRNP